MKKITSLCLSALLAFSAMLTPINAQAQDSESETIADTAIEEQCEPETIDEASAKLEELEASGVAELDSGTCGENVKWTLYENGALKIYGKGEMADYYNPSFNIDGREKELPPWSPYMGEIIKKVVIESGVTSIGDYAFKGVGPNECKNLQSVTMADSVTSIGVAAFRYCPNLQYITFSKKLSVIDEYAFFGCETITSLKFTSDLEIVDECAFRECIGLESVQFDKGVEIIGKSAFERCENLKTINLPDGLKGIGNCAFEYCTSLSSISIPASVIAIGNTPFAYCKSLNSINVASGNENYSSEDGVLFANGILIWLFEEDGPVGGEMLFYKDKDKSHLIACPAQKKGAYTIPDSVNIIYEAAFAYCVNLTSITIPDSVSEIRRFAFTNCKKLTSVDIPDSVKYMSPYAFSECENLKSVTLSPNLTDIDTAAFYGCTSLESIEIPSSVTSIETLAFGQCTSLKKVKMLDGVTEIGEAAFDSCPNLTNVTIPSSVTTIEEAAFGYNDTMTCDYFRGYINPNSFCDGQQSKMESFTIKGLKDSAAETYANENGFNFEAFGKYIGICGDIDSNGTIAAKDLYLLHRAVTGGTTLTNKQALLADANEDGEIDSTDILLLGRYLVGRYDFSNIGQKIYK